MADKHKLPFKAAEIDEKLRKVDNIADETIKRLSDSGQIGYEEETLVEVVSETTADFVPMEDLGGLPVVMNGFDPTPGATYTIKWDGVEYVRVATAEGTIGNRGIAGEEDTGEPFIFITEGAIATTEGEHTFSVREHKMVARGMAEKYLPEIPSCPITISYTTTGSCIAHIGSNDGQKLDAFLENGVREFWGYCVNKEGSGSFEIRFIQSNYKYEDGELPNYSSVPFNLGGDIWVIFLDVPGDKILACKLGSFNTTT